MSITPYENFSPAPNPEASVWRNVLTSVLAMPVMVIISIAIFLPFALLGIVDVTTAVITTIVAEILVIFLCLSVTNKTKNWRDVLYLKNFKIKNVLMGFSTGVLLFFFLQVGVTLLSSTGTKLESSDTSTELSQIPGFQKYAVLLFLVPFIVPLVEELLFRGVIFGFIARSGLAVDNKKFALILGTIASAFMFGLVHQQGFSSLTDIFIIFLTGTIGAVNCLLLYKTDSIYTSYASHMSYNLVTSLSSIIALSAQ
jgi:membrane protease YdiL (CAAX protease family)